MKTLPLLAALAALAAVTPCAEAHPQHQLPADANGDGRISLQEYQASRRAFIMRADTNHDGMVTRAEWDKLARSVRNQAQLSNIEGADVIGRARWFEAIDTDRNNVITPAEIDAMTAARFARLDLNHDGFIGRSEAINAANAAKAARR